MVANTKMKLFVVLLVALTISSTEVYGWDTEELEIFDLVEEINKNFYNFMGIAQVRQHLVLCGMKLVKNFNQLDILECY